MELGWDWIHWGPDTRGKRFPGQERPLPLRSGFFWSNAECLCWLRISAFLPASKGGRKCPLPRGTASCSPRHPGGWLCSRLSAVWSCPEKYRGQLILPPGAQALIIFGTVPPINRHYFFLSLSALLETDRICSLLLRMTPGLNSPSFLSLPVADIIGIGHLYSSTHFTER